MNITNEMINYYQSDYPIENHRDYCRYYYFINPIAGYLHSLYLSY